MNLSLIVVSMAVVLIVAYRWYGRLLARRLNLDPGQPTPARTHQDGVDFVPTPRFYLLGQHLSAIAAAGPIAGPILAGQLFGWGPALLWIGFGVVFIGAVHDMTVLVASVRHGGRTIAEVVRVNVGQKAWALFGAFIWVTIVYVIVAFTDIVAQTFVTGDAEIAGLDLRFNPGGAVALAATAYLGLSVVMGLVTRFLHPPLWLSTVIFVPGALGCVWLGTRFSTLLVLPGASPTRVWAMLILAYCLVASITPVWALLQPRGYLGGFVLYTALGVGVVGVFFGGYEIHQPAFRAWSVGGSTGTLFPFLFVTIACGACSGFHGLVCSGTTSKQVSRESHIRPIGYGAMLAEGFVALIALVTVMIVMPGDLAGLAPGTIYGNGIGRFLTLVIGEERLPFAITFGAMAFSTFVFDTLDVCMRLGRYIVQELVGWRGRAGAWAGTLLTVAAPVYFLSFGEKGTWIKFWTLFGASNQLLAGLTLLAITVWLYQARQRIAFTLLPMLFVLTITLWALGKLVIANLQATRGLDIELVNALASAALVALALYVAVAALLKLRGERRGSLVPERAG
jgi:carbon starvation protein